MRHKPGWSQAYPGGADRATRALPNPAAAAPTPAPVAPKPAAVQPAQPALKPPAGAPVPSAHLGRAQQFWADMRRSRSMMVIALCVGFFLALHALDWLHLVPWQRALSWFGLSYFGIANRFFLFQFLTAPLLHASILHLVFNMLALWWLGPDVEARLGQRRYVELAVLSAAASMGGFLALNWGRNAISCGYSGVIFGILVAQALFFPDRLIYIYAVFPLKMKHAVLLLGAIELFLAANSSGHAAVGGGGHLLGALAAWWYLRWGGWQRIGSLRLRSGSLLTGSSGF